jgi:ubiquitin-protein ligase/DNA-directed RNA polymerase subunit RPC12/RpoP
MSSPRVRRLESDYERISTRFAGWPLIQIELADGEPPDMYRIWYNIKGLYAATDGRILERDEHVLEIRLGLEYPRRAPQLRLLTPLFHPNFNNTEVCAQDIYAASEGLDDLVVRIGRMIAYQEYNTKSPLNGIAARWAAEHSHKLPVDGREIAPLAPGAHATPPPLPEEPTEESWENQIVIGEEELLSPPPHANGDPVEFDCPGCGTRLRSPADHVGKMVQCPSCKTTINVPTPADDEEEGETVIRFACPHCEQPLEAEADMAGDKIQCPSCGKIIVVQA